MLHHVRPSSAHAQCRCINAACRAGAGAVMQLVQCLHQHVGRQGTGAAPDGGSTCGAVPCRCSAGAHAPALTCPLHARHAWRCHSSVACKQSKWRRLLQAGAQKVLCLQADTLGVQADVAETESYIAADATGVCQSAAATNAGAALSSEHGQKLARSTADKPCLPGPLPSVSARPVAQ